jgi:hypothetical protein
MSVPLKLKGECRGGIVRPKLARTWTERPVPRELETLNSTLLHKYSRVER